MKKRLLQILLLTALLALSMVLMGGGNDCPKACVAPDTACALTCGGDPTGTCNEALECKGTGE
jgi:hypothetical protein